MSHLPKDLIAEILSCLEVNLLLRSRSVCKLWRDLIDSTDFVKLHLSRSRCRYAVIREEHLHIVGFDELERGQSVTAGKVEDHPLSCQDYGTEVWGCCNGLLLLVNSLDTLAIWNFATRKSRRLPHAAVEFKDLNNYVETRIYGFGYDKITDDYKIVRIVLLKERGGSFVDNEVKVYSLKSHTWHRVQKFPKSTKVKRTVGILVSGCLHWVVTEYGVKGGKIVTFDLEREVFRSVEQPDYPHVNFLMGLQALDGCLSISCNYYQDCVDIWVMKEYGVKESWTKLLSIKMMGLPRPFQYLHPITYSRNGKELLFEQDTDKLVWYNIENNKMRFVKVKGVELVVNLDVCLESLIPLDVVVDSSKQKQKEKEEKNMDNFLSKGFKLVL